MNEYKRALYGELCRRDFWVYCKKTAPDFYKEDRWHLKLLCETLQNLYEGKLIWNGKPTKKLLLSMPPQMGKTRTLILFCTWILGINNCERIIACSYNDSTASEFSRFTRDQIVTQKNIATDFDYSDIFPTTKIKHGNASHERWALENQHFNYLGAGIGGSITSKGGTVKIIDDPIKGAAEAINSNYLDKIWQWYTGTFLSRTSAVGGEPIEIVNSTRWATEDLIGKILKSKNCADWYVLKIEAMDKETGKMLCPELLSFKAYSDLKDIMIPEIFEANYHQNPMDVKGVMYSGFKTYESLPEGLHTIENYTDTADEGEDYLCSITYAKYKDFAYIIDVVYTKASMEITEPAVSTMLKNTDCKKAVIESNNGGRGFARAVEKITPGCQITWFHQSQNKQARIYAASPRVMNNVFFPFNWMDQWREFYIALSTYKKEGKNKHDDAPDAITGVVEQLNGIKFVLV